MTAAACTAPDATTAREALDALIAVRNNYDNLADQTVALIACADQGSDATDTLAARARQAQVPNNSALRVSASIGEITETAAGHLRRAEAALRNARTTVDRLINIAEESQKGRL